jgi:DNA repair and recombination protein RAD54B
VVKTAPIDIIIGDEGHRLKDPALKISQALSALPAKMRILLSGTPIQVGLFITYSPSTRRSLVLTQIAGSLFVQNDLGEFFAMINFVNPSILGTTNQFNNVYQSAIQLGREPGASKEEVLIAQSRSEQLSRLTSSFILRRTSEVNNAHLPPKSTCRRLLFLPPIAYLLFLTNLQVLFSSFLRFFLHAC